MDSKLSAFTLDKVYDLVASDLRQINQILHEWLQSDIILLNTLSDHIINGGGKRLRPLLVILIAHALGYQGSKHIQLATIIELIHVATLLHDDVIDGSNLRHSKPTINALFGNHASILCGDFLYSRAFQRLIAIQHWDLLNVLATVTNRITEGELLQLINLKESQISKECYLKTIEAKTAILFEAAAETAAILSNSETSFIQQLKVFGLNFGIAFQLIDDLLDYSGSTETLGKAAGNDYFEGKLTLPLIYALSNSEEKEVRQIRQALIERNNENFISLRQLIASSGAFTYTQQLANAKATLALQALEILPFSPYKQALVWLCDFATSRQY